LIVFGCASVCVCARVHGYRVRSHQNTTSMVLLSTDIVKLETISKQQYELEKPY